MYVLRINLFRLKMNASPATCLNTLTSKRRCVLLVPKTLSITQEDRLVSAVPRVSLSLMEKLVLLVLRVSTLTSQKKPVSNVVEASNMIARIGGVPVPRQLPSGTVKNAYNASSLNTSTTIRRSARVVLTPSYTVLCSNSACFVPRPSLSSTERSVRSVARTKCTMRLRTSVKNATTGEGTIR